MKSDRESLTHGFSPKRIVCLQPSATVILASMGELERVVACTKYCADVVPKISSISAIVVNDSWTAQEDQIRAVNADLVIAAVPYQEEAVSHILRAGIRFLGLAPRKLDDIYRDIMTIAGIVNAHDRGEELISRMQGQVSQIRKITGDFPSRKVFCEEWGKPLIASQPWVEELVQAAGGQFIGHAGEQITPSEVLVEDPDVLVAAWCGAGNRVPLEKIVRDRSWELMQAVMANNVFCIPDEYLNTPAPTLMKGLMSLAYAIHPELFPAPSGVRRITDVSRSHRQAPDLS